MIQKNIVLLTLANFLIASVSWAGSPAVIRIGMVQSMFTDVSPGKIRFLTPQIQTLVQETTGFQGDIVIGGNAKDLAGKLRGNQVQLGAFHGVEFAWIQKKHPELKPLVIAIRKYKNSQSHILVNKESEIKSFADLKGKILSLGLETKENSRLFLEKNCSQEQCESKDFFGKIQRPKSYQHALDEVAAKKAEVTVVDSFELEHYRYVYPGRFNKMKVLKNSETFPAAVIAYREGGLSDSAIQRFRAGMLAAHQTRNGEDLMMLWGLTSFENLPSDYQQNLNNILAAYPPPQEGERLLNQGKQ